jgi:CBS domain-containing protein
MASRGLSLVHNEQTARSADCRSADVTTVADVMSRDVATIHRETPVHQVARVLLEWGLPGAPVIDSESRVIGVVGEDDLLARLRPRARRRWWRMLAGRDDLANEYRRASGITAGEVMTHPAVTVAPALPVSSAVALLDDSGVGLLPVVDKEQLVGTLSCRDLLKCLSAKPTAHTRWSDADLVTEMQERMSQESWVPARHPLVFADDGVVALWGLVETESQKLALETMASTMPGCRAVDSQLIVVPAIARGIV